MTTKEEILRRTQNGLNIFQHYIPTQWRVGKNFLNPLYNDTKASCSVYFSKLNNCYKIKDFGNCHYSGDCFFFVGKLKGLECSNTKDFIEILQIINQDLNLGLMDENPVSIPKVKNQEKTISQPSKSKPYYIVQKSFSPKEISYWQQYGVGLDILKQFKVISLSEFKSENREGNKFSLTAGPEEPIFCYSNKHFVKIYRPFSNIRFLYGGNIGDNYCFGLEQLPAKGDVLFITGGEKDVMSLAAKGFNAICFNSETANIPQDTIRKLSYMFKHIVLLYDMDETGQEASLKQEQQLSEFGVKRLLLPLAGTKESKDISDYFRLGNTAGDFTKLFIELLDSLYGETMAILKSCEINFDNPPPQAQMIVSVNDVPLGTQGNLLCITGGEGTGKSNYVGSLVAGSILEEEKTIDTLGLTIHPNSKQKAVLLYDTEQSEVQLYKNISNILRRSKRKDMPSHFKSYCLTSMSRKERLQAIIQSMDKFYYEFGGIQMVVIDGIADLIRGANDEVESVALIDELYRLAGIYKTCIVCVLHFIPNGLKLRGHLGSELQRKAAAILSIEKDSDPNISVVKAMKVRDGSPLDVPLMQFAWNKELGMHSYVGEKPKEEKEKRKENELTSVARNLFSRKQHYTYQELCEDLQMALDVKERTAKSYISFMREKEIIIKDPSNASYFMIGLI